MKKTVCLTFDIEDWFQVENLRKVFPPETWDKQELRVEKNTHKILDILEEHNIKATFFVLGWIAERVPKLVKEISKRGHEIASHGYGHLLNYNLSREQLKQDLLKSKKVLEDITGKTVIGYRAPSFSISDELMKLLAELGFRYDSSFNDFAKHDRYGKLSGAEGSKPFMHETEVYEFPLPVVKKFGQNIPISGGGYFRIMPLAIFKKLVMQYLNNNKLYIFYMHPWEIDVTQPRIKKIKKVYYIRHYFGLSTTFNKLKNFIQMDPNNTQFITLNGLISTGGNENAYCALK